jgi:hypothetical protein
MKGRFGIGLKRLHALGDVLTVQAAPYHAVLADSRLAPESRPTPAR